MAWGSKKKAGEYATREEWLKSIHENWAKIPPKSGTGIKALDAEIQLRFGAVPTLETPK